MRLYADRSARRPASPAADRRGAWRCKADTPGRLAFLVGAPTGYRRKFYDSCGFLPCTSNVFWGQGRFEQPSIAVGRVRERLTKTHHAH